MAGADAPMRFGKRRATADPPSETASSDASTRPRKQPLSVIHGSASMLRGALIRMASRLAMSPSDSGGTGKRHGQSLDAAAGALIPTRATDGGCFAGHAKAVHGAAVCQWYAVQVGGGATAASMRAV